MDEALETKFLTEATAAHLIDLKGHRSVGGCRASLYNAMPVEGVQALIDFMTAFREANEVIPEPTPEPKAKSKKSSSSSSSD